jgi:hypothetical protein
MARTKKGIKEERKTYSWVLLLDSRHAKPPKKEPIGTGDRGRPRLNVATSQTSMTLSKGDREAIDFWQDYLSSLLNRKVSMGETVGFLARACQERLNVVSKPDQRPESLQDLVHSFVNGEGEA